MSPSFHFQSLFPRRGVRLAYMFLALASIVLLGQARYGNAAEISDGSSPSVRAERREKALGVLRETLASEPKWVKVHAAENLIALDYPQGVSKAFEKELQEHGETPEYRIGIWRVLARASSNSSERKDWIQRIRDVLVDPASPDRTHAIESLAKLGYFPEKDKEAQTAVQELASKKDHVAAPFAYWALANGGGSGRERAKADLTALLGSSDERTRLAAAYSLRHLAPLSNELVAKLREAYTKEPSDSSAKTYLLAASFVASPAVDPGLKEGLHAIAKSGSKTDRYEAVSALAERGSANDEPLLTELLNEPEADVRQSAAGALLRIARRSARGGMTVFDWGVIGLYGFGMLAIGWWYSRSSSTEDYLLGNRQMRPMAVGLSLFASLMSTISYLAVPGEMIEHGPMFASRVLAYPFIALIVGWLLIPFIMRLRITTAYEILELRLGPSVRVVGSLLFLSLRLLWMAVIIYATADKVLVPLLALDSSATPYICAAMGLLTMIYTSMGGLRAVVLTDVIQTLILFGGAILAIIMATVTLGGIGPWFPSEWPAQWDPPTFGYDPSARMTFAGAFIATLTWWVCTAGSDQMAVQRYLSTRNAQQARRALIISLISDVLVTILLAFLGLALLAYYRANPHLLGDGQTLGTGSDKLFPRFIVYGLPPGVTGLIIAGLLAAAMSSLSSGLNSSCSVVTIDFIDRFRRNKDSVTDHVSLAKYVSAVIGILVVLISCFVNQIQGNLLDVTFKVVNLLTAPLFVLFFMAMFVRWATPLGTLAGGISSVAIAVAIAFWEVFDLKILWIMPVSLVVGIVVGVLVSLVPIGKGRVIPIDALMTPPSET